jgi:hypothetical protein
MVGLEAGVQIATSNIVQHAGSNLDAVGRATQSKARTRQENRENGGEIPSPWGTISQRVHCGLGKPWGACK